MNKVKDQICKKYELLTTEKIMLIKKIWQIEYEIDKLKEKIKKYGLQENLGLVQESENNY